MRALTEFGLIAAIIFGSLGSQAQAASVKIDTGRAQVIVSNTGGSVETDEGLVAWGSETAPGPDYVRVESAHLGGEIGVPGYWRVRSKPGFVWVEGSWNGELYVPGFWRPAKVRRGMVWVPGHWYGRRWIAGRWRPEFKQGYVWIDGHWNRQGEWVEGHWRPQARPRRNMVWEPGYWGPNGWMEGFWRPVNKHGYIWIVGEWDEHGRWIPGRWDRAHRNERWVRGYWDHNGRYVPGRKVRLKNPNAYQHGHYNRHGQWVNPSWEERREEAIKQADEFERSRRGESNPPNNSEDIPDQSGRTRH